MTPTGWEHFEEYNRKKQLEEAAAKAAQEALKTPVSLSAAS